MAYESHNAILMPSSINFTFMKCCSVKCVSLTLLVIGGLNWGLVAISPSYNLVEMLLGTWPMAVRIVYGLVGLGAIMYGVDQKFCPCNTEAKSGCCGSGKCK